MYSTKETEGSKPVGNDDEIDCNKLVEHLLERIRYTLEKKS